MCVCDTKEEAKRIHHTLWLEIVKKIENKFFSLIFASDECGKRSTSPKDWRLQKRGNSSTSYPSYRIHHSHPRKETSDLRRRPSSRSDSSKLRRVSHDNLLHVGHGININHLKLTDIVFSCIARFIIARWKLAEKEETASWVENLPCFAIRVCSEERRGNQYKSFQPVVDDNVIFQPRVFVLFADVHSDGGRLAILENRKRTESKETNRERKKE